MPAYLIALLLQLNPAFAATEIIACRNAEEIDQTSDLDHSHSADLHFKPMHFSVTVAENEEGGFSAGITDGEASRTETDVSITVERASALPHVQEMAKRLAPQVDYSLVTSVRVANIGAASNKTGHGIYLYELLGSHGESLAMLGSYRFTYLRCGQ